MKQLPWIKVSRWGPVSFHCSAKAGSQTLLKAVLMEFGIRDPGFGHRRAALHHLLVKEYLVSVSDVPRLGEAVQFVRDPQERFESLWRWGCHSRNQGIPAVLWDEEPQTLLEYIKDNLYDNIHWCPQSVVTPHATRVARLEQMADLVPCVTSPVNSTRRVAIPAYDTELLNQLYINDFLLWENIT